jgi:hypothetical protein
MVPVTLPIADVVLYATPCLPNLDIPEIKLHLRARSGGRVPGGLGGLYIFFFFFTLPSPKNVGKNTPQASAAGPLGTRLYASCQSNLHILWQHKSSLRLAQNLSDVQLDGIFTGAFLIIVGLQKLRQTPSNPTKQRPDRYRQINAGARE